VAGTGYLELLRAPHAARLLVGTLLGRLPNATAPIAVVLLARADGADYSLAGTLAAVYGLANAVGQPLLGRAVDLLGQPRVQLPAALVSALGTAGLVAAGTGTPPAAFAAVAVAGFAAPPLEGGLRALWPSVLAVAPDEGAAATAQRVHRAYAMDAVAQEVMFTVGPLLVTALVALRSPAAALLVIAGLGVIGALSVVVSPPSRAWRSAPREAHWLGALRSPGLLALLGAFLFVGVALGSITVAGVAYGDEHGSASAYGWLMAALGLGALTGGVLYGARRWAGPAERRLRIIVALLALCYLPLALTPGVVAMTLLAVGAGLFLAPAIACAFVVVDRHAPRGTVTEAFSWLVTTFGVGSALGTAVAGPVAQASGAAAGFLVAGAGGLVALLVLLTTKGALTGGGGSRSGDRGTENDRSGAVQHGLGSGHRA
jgi:predicted MFS family arabinose efflux permease